jgi:proteasome lid subunit RPN8/RPN11
MLLIPDPGRWHRIVSDALADEAMERCGLLLGEREGDAWDARARRMVLEVLPVRNVSPEPAHAYELEAASLLGAYRREREGGLEVLGAYHSHPDGSTIPSARDEALAHPGFSYLIVARGPRWACWVHTDQGFVEELVVVGGPLSGG